MARRSRWLAFRGGRHRRFADGPVFDYRSTKRGDSRRGRALMLDLFAQRVFLNPMGTKLYLSLAHDEAVCDEFLGRFDHALRR